MLATHVGASDTPEVIKWEWEPDRGDPLKRLDRALFCQKLLGLGLGRVHIVGDSMSFQHFLSMYMLVDGTNDLATMPSSWGDGGYQKNITCADLAGPQNVSMRFNRNDLLTRCSNKPMCGDWATEFLSYQRKTLLILNMGAHLHSTKMFTAYIKDLYKWLKPALHTRSNQDVVFFRTTASGHVNCQAHLKPLPCVELFKTTTMYDWNGFSSYNQIAADLFSKAESEVPNLFMLNVDPMTKLRPDHHKSGNDCLHYKLPSVIDWWSNMLFRELARLPLAPGTNPGQVDNVERVEPSNDTSDTVLPRLNLTFCPPVEARTRSY